MLILKGGGVIICGNEKVKQFVKQNWG